MATRPFTTKAVEGFKPDPQRRLELPDPGHAGLYIVVQPSGAKSWALRYRLNGKPAKLTLGRWPIMGLADARAAASEAVQKVEHGTDPAAEKQATKAARRAAALSERDKVQALVEQFDRRHLSKLRTGRAVRQAFDLHVIPVWGEREVGTITRRDVLDLLDGLADAGKGTTANRVRAYLSKFFGWCAEREAIEVSPVLGVKAPAKERQRERILSDDEIRWFWRACEAVGQPWGPLGKILLLTGQRLSEVAGMTRAEIEGNTWRLSSDRTKNHRPHDVPLSVKAAAVLRAVEAPAGKFGFVHTTTGRAPVRGFHKGRLSIAEAMAKEAAKDRGGPVEIAAWGWHDLRRTCATGMARLGIPVRVTEAVLNHISGTGGGIVAVYQRHDYADEKGQALEAWARSITSLVEGQPGNVVSIAEARL